MKLLIVLAALVASTIAGPYKGELYQYKGPLAPLSSDGMVVDTPEVAHARAVHLAVHAEALTQLRKAQNGYDAYNDDTPVAPKTQSPHLMMAPLAPDGRVIDTPEVAAAKSAHMAAHARAASKASEFYELGVFDGRKNLVYLAPLQVTYNQATPIVYRGPFAPLAVDGRIIDRPEVVSYSHAIAKSTKNGLYY